jgi:hypothetical protein
METLQTNFARRAMKAKTIFSAMLAAGILSLANRAAAQWSAVTTTPGGVGISTMLLLSDGSVMGQVQGGTGWLRLIPSLSGNYSGGTWTNNIQSMNHTRTYFASDMLQNGQMFVGGGELGNGSDWVEIYNPVANNWTDVGPAYFGGMADAESVVLDNGQILVDPQATDGYGHDTFIFNPADNTWSDPIVPLHDMSEDSWVKLADDSILAVDSDGSSYGALTSERYVPATGAWTNAGTLPVSIWADLPNGGVVGETGPGFLLPNGNAIFFGGNGNTAIYKPGTGTWVQGPSFPGGLVSADAPGAMMPDGKILLCVGQIIDSTNANNDWQSPISFFEYNYTVGTTGSLTQVLAPGNSSYTMNAITYPCRMLLLPTGNVLFTTGSSQLYIYQEDSGPLAAGQPTINNVQWDSDGSLTLTGTLFDGISEGAAYGDDQQMATDFPLVRFTDGSGDVYYGRTYNWSSTSVQTGGETMTTQVTIPPDVFQFTDVFSLQVVANGNPSPGVTFYSPVWVDFNLDSPVQLGWYDFPYYTLPQGVSAINSSYPGGTIGIRGDVQPSTGNETVPYTISTPMTIISVSGPSTIQ